MRRARPLLGTYVHIEAWGLPDRDLERAVAAAFRAVERVQRLMSFHEPGSDLSRLNREAARSPVRVHPWTFAVLRRAQRLFRASDSLFDCAIGHRLQRWGLLPGGAGEILHGRFSAVRLLPNHQVTFTSPVVLDLGGIAKGFAVDCAIADLRRRGVRNALVNAGGDLRVMGEAAHPMYVRNPVRAERLTPVGLLQNGAVATSSPWATRVRILGGDVSALVEPASGKAIVDRCSYSVIAPTCVVADALTKVLAQVKRADAPIFARFGAAALVVADASERSEVA